MWRQLEQAPLKRKSKASAAKRSKVTKSESFTLPSGLDPATAALVQQALLNLGAKPSTPRKKPKSGSVKS